MALAGGMGSAGTQGISPHQCHLHWCAIHAISDIHSEPGRQYVNGMLRRCAQGCSAPPQTTLWATLSTN